MSMTLWLNIRAGDACESNEVDHSAVFSFQDALDQIAAKLNVTPLSAFYDDTDVRYNMDETGEFDVSEDGWPASAAKWFPAESVMSSVSAVLNYLQEHPGVLLPTDGWTQADVLEDLRDFMPELQRAAASSKTAHLCIVA